MSRDVGFTTRRIRQRKETYITGYRVHEQCVTHTQFTFVTHTRFELCETHVSFTCVKHAPHLYVCDTHTSRMMCDTLTSRLHV